MARSAQETDSKLGDAAKAELQNAIETPLSQMMDEESKSHDEAFIDLALETLECAPHSREITDGPGDAGIDYYEMTPTTATIALMECATRSAFRLDSRPSMMFLPRGRGREGRSGAPGAVIGLRGNRFANPGGLVELSQRHAGTLKLRPDQRIAYLRN
jgi:hypothetical protein